MRRILIAVLVFTALWAGYWFGVARLLERGADSWFVAQTEAGMIAGHDGLRVTGFPLRFDLTVTRPHLGDAATGGWSAPEARVSARAWMPWRVTLDLPEQQVVALPGQEVTVSSYALTTTVAVTPGTALPLDWSSLTGDGVSMLSSQGWRLAVEHFTTNTQRTETDPLTHDLRIEATSITPDKAFRQRLAKQSTLPELIDGLLLDAALTFSAPLDRTAAETQPHLTALTLRNATVTWGDLVLAATGELVPDANGLVEGRIDLRLTSWRALVPVLVAAQLITPEVAPTVTRALEVLAKDATAKDLEVPLVMSEGWMRLGPIPLGPAPLVVQRQ